MAKPILPTDNNDPFLDALAHLGWMRVQHGEYLHDDGSVIVANPYVDDKGVQRRRFTLNGHASCPVLENLIEYHRGGGR